MNVCLCVFVCTRLEMRMISERPTVLDSDGTHE